MTYHNDLTYRLPDQTDVSDIISKKKCAIIFSNHMDGYNFVKWRKNVQKLIIFFPADDDICKNEIV